eukprot:TRINITY_DN86337_c0_g1_i1.p1 TRINITY_DN86337_c0_g1~~TRINITY_DN86337_c0_g1_i1.p1  ORF type:complete len:306 (-),score=72.91 TRINITY_DN86337_c0_g1_i1:55-918(-)
MVCERYEVVRELSAGEGSSVELVRDAKTGKEFARKRLATEGLPQELLELIANESKLLSELDHANVVRLLAVEEAQGELVQILEYLPGGSCCEMLGTAEALPERLVALIIGQVISALSHCHGKGIVHRDVKPENIMADHDCYKLIDFGLAVKAEGPLRMAAGTEEYMAPEMLASSPSYGEKVDMWSCGVSTFQLLFGTLPFGSEHPAKHIRLYQKSSDPEGELVAAASQTAWHALSADARDFLRCTLSPNPSRRISAAEAAKHPWLLHASMEDSVSERSTKSGLVGGA